VIKVQNAYLDEVKAEAEEKIKRKQQTDNGTITAQLGFGPMVLLICTARSGGW
jgi:hypothetical protein